MKRREFGRATLGALAGIVVPSPGVDGPVSIEHVGALRRVVAELWSRDREVGGSALLTEAKGYYSTARGWLDTGTYTTAVGADLVAVAAELAACAGFIAFDASDQMKARGLLTESLILSGSTPHLAAELTAHEATAAVHLGQAERAAGIYRDVLATQSMSARNRVFYSARLAGALEAAGDHQEAVGMGLGVLDDLEGAVRSGRALNLLKPMRARSIRGDEFTARYDAQATA